MTDSVLTIHNFASSSSCSAIGIIELFSVHSTPSGVRGTSGRMVPGSAKLKCPGVYKWIFLQRFLLMGNIFRHNECSLYPIVCEV